MAGTDQPAADAGAAGSPALARAAALLRRMAWVQGAGTAAAAILLVVLGRIAATAPAVQEALRAGLAGTVLAAALLAQGGLAAAALMAWAREIGRPSLVGRTARRPQAVIVPALAVLAAATALRLEPTATLAAPGLAVPLGLGALLLAFPMLVMERVAAGLDPRVVPEARALQALLFVPVAATASAGVLEVLAAGRMLWPRELAAVLVLALLAVAAELAVRASANWFLPPADPARARAAVASLAAQLLRPHRLAQGGLAAPLREHLGIDFARSWALRFLRAAVVPVAAVVVLVGWSLSGVSLIGLDERGVQERFGAPVRVLQPGLHWGLPWPFGRVRRTELGVVHATAIGSATQGTTARVGAEDVPPPALDRLWEVTHPAEADYVIASPATVAGDARQSFQTVSVDLRVLYRIGLDDRSALRVAYGQADPQALVRAQAARVVGAFFAGQTLPALLEGDREALEGRLRAALQDSLDRLGGGVDVLGMTIEAIHPPAGAAAAYHDVQAAEIVANTAIAIERGRAIADRNRALTTQAETRDKAAAAAAETVGAAQVAARQFRADQQAAQVGGQAFLLERYLGNVAGALSKAPVVIVDHRLGGADGPTIDLRSFGPAAPGQTDTD